MQHGNASCLHPVSTEDLSKEIRDRRIVLLSIVSFEERCTGAGRFLLDQAYTVSKLLLFHYKTEAEPFEVDKELRALHREEIVAASRGATIQETEVNPYATTPLREELVAILESLAENVVIIDITCMTQVHVLAVASVVASLVREDRAIARRLLFAYSAPESYLHMRGVRPGWRDTLLVPIGSYRPFRREGHAHGIVLAGHDVERLSIALEELEPGAGSVIFSDTPRRPDFLKRALEINRAATERLLSLRFPRDNAVMPREDEGWEEIAVRIGDFSGLYCAVRKQIDRALLDSGPVILFPFGPKILALAASLQLCQELELSAWAMYPVPTRYSVEFTDGLASTSIFALST